MPAVNEVVEDKWSDYKQMLVNGTWFKAGDAPNADAIEDKLADILNAMQKLDKFRPSRVRGKEQLLQKMKDANMYHNNCDKKYKDYIDNNLK